MLTPLDKLSFLNCPHRYSRLAEKPKVDIRSAPLLAPSVETSSC